ncbi:MAG: hypothetical protein A3B23_01935 [Candidatus Colwellbacteria bacterium RIFCSPLOWO2_01_FULL_48_10]|uniref:CoA-binding domain-containing protein n=2 Tax=Bacteria candidate phyla TaxID=1783234 RepID=A0A1F5NZY9_9BACT|nr:MAG: hypothetical protein A2846_05135 [Candidatus Doudnabacteria bacterium RIFCSPHIGHO2_01_FULL_49_9]OGY59752.1 MAG: hypothetical protein A3B23_01935 [Candidatus Colwellbacteria bacterium RIFCSPLOWO2_01_FULL_48_10]
MAILINKYTRVLIQGITGGEGSRAAKEMIDYGTNVVCGVTPGKGGQSVEGMPVYNSIKEALEKHRDVNVSLIAVPATFIRKAALEAIENRIQVINILTEHVTVEDCALIYASAKKAGVMVIGPSSVGVISPGFAKLGVIGSGEVKNVFTPGNVGVISKSGGMTAEISSVLSQAGIGQSTAINIGGDQIIGSDFVDILKLFQSDPETKAVVMFGEVGGSYEELAAEFIKSGGFTKPVIAVIAGSFSEKLPKETVLGHAGAIVSQGRGSYASKVKALGEAGVFVTSSLIEMVDIVKNLK